MSATDIDTVCCRDQHLDRVLNNDLCEEAHESVRQGGQCTKELGAVLSVAQCLAS